MLLCASASSIPSFAATASDLKVKVKFRKDDGYAIISSKESNFYEYRHFSNITQTYTEIHSRIDNYEMYLNGKSLILTERQPKLTTSYFFKRSGKQNYVLEEVLEDSTSQIFNYGKHIDGVAQKPDPAPPHDEPAPAEKTDNSCDFFRNPTVQLENISRFIVSGCNQTQTGEIRGILNKITENGTAESKPPALTCIVEEIKTNNYLSANEFSDLLKNYKENKKNIDINCDTKNDPRSKSNYNADNNKITLANNFFICDETTNCPNDPEKKVKEKMRILAHELLHAIVPDFQKKVKYDDAAIEKKIGSILDKCIELAKISSETYHLDSNAKQTALKDSETTTIPLGTQTPGQSSGSLFANSSLESGIQTFKGLVFPSGRGTESSSSTGSRKFSPPPQKGIAVRFPATSTRTPFDIIIPPAEAGSSTPRQPSAPETPSAQTSHGSVAKPASAKIGTGADSTGKKILGTDPKQREYPVHSPPTNPSQRDGASNSASESSTSSSASKFVVDNIQQRKPVDPKILEQIDRNEIEKILEGMNTKICFGTEVCFGKGNKTIYYEMEPKTRIYKYKK